MKNYWKILAVVSAAFILFLFILLAEYNREIKELSSKITEAQKTDNKIFQFENYPAEKTAIKISTPLDFKNNLDAAYFKTVLTREYAKGPNFAGHYTVADWGCGTRCMDFAIIDNTTGKIYLDKNFQANEGLAYDINSELFIVNPPLDLKQYHDERNLSPEEKIESRKKTWEHNFPSVYYKWENKVLTQLH